MILFGLKNAGATYQRLVTKMFRPLLGKTMEIYIDDMLVKSKNRLDHTKPLEEAFELLRVYGMMLNPSKCAFGVSAGQFLGFIVTQRGIEANPAQLKSILESPVPTSRKGVQQLTGYPRKVHLSVYRPSKAVLRHPQGGQQGRVGPGV